MVTFLASLTTVLEGGGDFSLYGCRKIRICDPPPPPVLAGALTEVRAGAAGITLYEVYAERNLTIPKTLTQQAREWPGRLITYRAEFQGLECTCEVRWTLYDANTGKRIPSPTNRWKTIRIKAFPHGEWVVWGGQTDRINGIIWVPNVAEGTFFVEVELLNQQSLNLDIERSEPFEVAAADEPEWK